MTYFLNRTVTNLSVSLFSLLMMILMSSNLVAKETIVKELSLEHYKALHDRYLTNYQSESVSSHQSAKGISKFLLSGKQMKLTPVLNKTEARKNKHIDYNIFASPRNSKTIKRIAA